VRDNPFSHPRVNTGDVIDLQLLSAQVIERRRAGGSKCIVVQEAIAVKDQIFALSIWSDRPSNLVTLGQRTQDCYIAARGTVTLTEPNEDSQKQFVNTKVTSPQGGSSHHQEHHPSA